MKYVIPEYTTSDEIKNVRHLMKMTQKDFAAFVGVSKPTVERWERSGKDKITGPIVPLLELLKRDQTIPARLEVPEKRYPLRLWYIYNNTVCTLIDVDEVSRIVQITNYVEHPLYRAFGVKEHPTYEDYEAFLESRCFPESRDKIKLELENLNLPFYDPLLIIEKTQGRMAEDHFWIKVER